MIELTPVLLIRTIDFSGEQKNIDTCIILHFRIYRQISLNPYWKYIIEFVLQQTFLKQKKNISGRNLIRSLNFSTIRVYQTLIESSSRYFVHVRIVP